MIFSTISLFLLPSLALANRERRQATTEIDEYDYDEAFFAEAALYGDYYDDLAALEAMLAEFEAEYGDYTADDDALLAELDALLEEEAKQEVPWKMDEGPEDQVEASWNHVEREGFGAF